MAPYVSLLLLALPFAVRLGPARADAAPPELDEEEDWPGLETAVDEERLLQLESSSRAFAGDDTSLLQVRVELPSAARRPPPRERAVVPGDARRKVRYDVPEASWAWALFQEVPDGPPRPDRLANFSRWEPPGDIFPNESAVLEERMREIGGRTYSPPTHPGRNSPDWVWACFGRDFDINNASSWASIAVATPQLVPFVVPPDHPNRTDVSVIVAPGGGGQVLAWEIEGTDVAKWLNTLGISAFVLKYRVPKGTLWDASAAVMDAQRAVSLVRHMAPAFNLNASRVGIFGASHGGWVSLFTAFAAGRQYARRDVVDDQNPRPDFLLLLYPEVHADVFAKRAESDQPVEVHENVALTDLRNPPPIFISTGANDKCCRVESMYKLHSALIKRGDATMEMHVYPGVKHGWALCWRSEEGGPEAMKNEACLWMLRARRFIMWNVEGAVPEEAMHWYNETSKYDALIADGAHAPSAPLS